MYITSLNLHLHHRRSCRLLLSGAAGHTLPINIVLKCPSGDHELRFHADDLPVTLPSPVTQMRYMSFSISTPLSLSLSRTMHLTYKRELLLLAMQITFPCKYYGTTQARLVDPFHFRKEVSLRLMTEEDPYHLYTTHAIARKNSGPKTNEIC